MTSIALMRHRCTIERQTSSNSGGVESKAWASSATGVRCLIQEARGQQRSGPDAIALEYDAIAFFPPSTDIQPQSASQQRDRITMTSPTRMSGRKFTVVHVADECGMENHLTAFLKHVGE